MWLLRKEGKACPVCRAAINVDQLQRFALGKNQQKQQEDPPPRVVNNEPAPKSRRHFEYSHIDPGVFKSIQTMEAHGSYGTKIQTLIRHLLYIQIVEPGAKSIVFSAWADSLFSKFMIYYSNILTHIAHSY
jgi:E3 ubiquitin-protein ligase SHPRH